MTSPSSYLDFDLLIVPGQQGYNARVIHSPAGQAEGDFTLPFDDQGLQMLVLQIFRLSARQAVRAIASPEMTDVRTFGTKLFDTVFSGPVGTSLLRSKDRAREAGAGLRLRIHLDDVPALSNVPWELLYDQASGEFLCLSDQTPLVRYIDLAEPAMPLTVDPPLRVLTIVSSPARYPALDVEKEWQNVNEGLAGLIQEGRVALERLQTPTIEALQQRLRRADYHVLHFIGHGTFDEDHQDGVLLFEDLAGKGDPVFAESLGVILNDHESLRLVLLNACEGARTSASDPFAGTAQTLVRIGVPAVIAMQFEVTDLAAKAISKEFYSALADGWPIDAALAEARKAVFARVNAVEWATPVLYMRAPDGRIFDVQTSEAPTAVIGAGGGPLTRTLTEEDSARTGPTIETPPETEPVVRKGPKEAESAAKREAPEAGPEQRRKAPEEEQEERAEPGPAQPSWWERNRKVALPVAAAAAVVAVIIWVSTALVGGDGGGPSPTPPGAQSGLASPGGAGLAIPDVSAASLDTAVDQLKQLGFVVARPVDRPSRSIPQGLVAGTDPEPGAPATAGQRVTVYVSSGPWIAYTTDVNDAKAGSCGRGNPNASCDWDIYLTQPGNSRQAKLFATTGADVWPAWSQDGSKLAFASNVEGNYEIYVVDSSGRNNVRLTDASDDDLFPAWSPDDSRIVFVSYRLGDEDIWVMNSDGSGPEQLTTSAGQDEAPRWSPDGSSIVFYSNRDGRQQIYLMDPDGGNERNISNSTTDEFGAVWSPDGSQLAFRRGGNIWVMNQDGSEKVELTTGGTDAQPVWSPDGDFIAFRSTRDDPGGPEDIWVMNADGSDPVNLTNTPGSGEQRPTW